MKASALIISVATIGDDAVANDPDRNALGLSEFPVSILLDDPFMLEFPRFPVFEAALPPFRENTPPAKGLWPSGNGMLVLFSICGKSGIASSCSASR